MRAVPARDGRAMSVPALPLRGADAPLRTRARRSQPIHRKAVSVHEERIPQAQRGALQGLLRLHPRLPGEGHRLCQQSGQHHRRRVRAVRQLLRHLPAERQAHPRGRAHRARRHPRGQARGGQRGPVLPRGHGSGHHRGHARYPQKARLCRRGGDRRGRGAGLARLRAVHAQGFRRDDLQLLPGGQFADREVLSRPAWPPPAGQDADDRPLRRAEKARQGRLHRLHRPLHRQKARGRPVRQRGRLPHL